MDMALQQCSKGHIISRRDYAKWRTYKSQLFISSTTSYKDSTCMEKVPAYELDSEVDNGSSVHTNCVFQLVPHLHLPSKATLTWLTDVASRFAAMYTV